MSPPNPWPGSIWILLGCNSNLTSEFTTSLRWCPLTISSDSASHPARLYFSFLIINIEYVSFSFSIFLLLPWLLQTSFLHGGELSRVVFINKSRRVVWGWGQCQWKEPSLFVYLKATHQVLRHDTIESSTNIHHLPASKATRLLSENCGQKLLRKDSGGLYHGRPLMADTAQCLMVENLPGLMGKSPQDPTRLRPWEAMWVPFKRWGRGEEEVPVPG